MTSRIVKVGLLMSRNARDNFLKHSTSLQPFPHFEVDYKYVDCDGLNQQEIICSVDGLEVLVTDPACIKSWLNAVPKSVKWIQATWAGLDAMMKGLGNELSTFKPHFVLTMAKGCFGPMIAEYVLAAIFSMKRQFKALYMAQEQHKWLLEKDAPCLFSFQPFTSLTLGVLGAGDIGLEIAKMAKMVGMTVYGLKRTPPNLEQTKYVDKFFKMEELDQLLSSCDFICNVLPSTSLTQDLLSDKRLKICHLKSPGFINVGRGDIISEHSLIEALNEGWISAAFLDVFKEEPLPANNPLWKIKNITITPHSSGPTQPGMIWSVFQKNLQLYLSDKPLSYQFNWKALY